MRSSVRWIAFAFAVGFSATPAWADGIFTLTTVTGSSTRVLNVTKTGNDYNGSLTIDGNETLVTATFSSDAAAVTFSGAYSGSMDVLSTTDGIGYAGIVNGRLVAADAKFGANKIVYDGSVGLYDDLAGKSDGDKLTLFWGKSKLTLFRGDAPGTCSGVVKSEGQITATVSCETTGDPTVDFFTNPEMVVLWLVNELIN